MFSWMQAMHEDLVILGFKRNEDIKEDGASTDDDDDDDEVYEPVESRSFFNVFDNFIDEDDDYI